MAHKTKRPNVITIKCAVSSLAGQENVAYTNCKENRLWSFSQRTTAFTLILNVPGKRTKQHPAGDKAGEKKKTDNKLGESSQRPSHHTMPPPSSLVEKLKATPDFLCVH